MNSIVSVIIPTYGRPDFLQRAIESVLNQTYQHVEIIVVDDNGKGTKHQIETEEIISRYSNVKYIIHDINKNGSAARNTGIDNANGKYICFLDDDDEFLPQKIEKQIFIMENNDCIACICGHYRCFEDGRVESYGVSLSGDIVYEILSYKVDLTSGSSLMVRADICRDIKWDESLKRSQDYNFLARVAAAGKIIVFDEPLVRINTHSGSYHLKNFEEIEQNYTKYMRSIEHIIKKLPLSYQRNIYLINNFQMLKNAIKKRKAKKAITYYFKCGNIFITGIKLVKVLITWMKKKIKQ